MIRNRSHLSVTAVVMALVLAALLTVPAAAHHGAGLYQRASAVLTTPAAMTIDQVEL